VTKREEEASSALGNGVHPLRTGGAFRHSGAAGRSITAAAAGKVMQLALQFSTRARICPETTEISRPAAE